MDPEQIAVPVEIAEAFEQYQVAKSARARWAQEEKEIKEKLLTFLGYDDEDPKPQPVTAVTPKGTPIFEVTIGNWRGMDFDHLKSNFPDVYAICERNKPTKGLRSA